MPLSGVFTLGSGKLWIGRLIFEYGSRDQTTSLASRIIRIAADSEAFKANLDVPLEGESRISDGEANRLTGPRLDVMTVSLETEPRLNLTLYSGRNRIRDAAINLMSATEGVTFYYPGSTCSGSQSWLSFNAGLTSRLTDAKCSCS